jgi:dTDP-4-dehydrorhamnose reductase
MSRAGTAAIAYVDAEAVRVKRLEPDTGIGPRLARRGSATACRSPSPRSITAATATSNCAGREVVEHRWASCATRESDLRAVTLWSMFGNVDWRFLLTWRNGFYDTGVFDARGDQPRPTVIAEAAKAWAKGEDYDHPVLDSAPAGGGGRRASIPGTGAASRFDWGGRKLLITGATGTLGNAFARICEERALPFCLTGRAELDICRRGLDRRGDRGAAAVGGDQRRRVRPRRRCGARARGLPRRQCRRPGAARAGLSRFRHPARHLLLRPRLRRPRSAGLSSKPIRSTRRASTGSARPRRSAGAGRHGRGADRPHQRLLRAVGPVQFRLGRLISPSPRRAIRAPANVHVSPTYVPDLVPRHARPADRRRAGLWHLANPGRISWYDFARRVAEGAGYDPDLVVPAEAEEPRVTALTSARGILLRPFDDALADWLRELRETEALAALAAE